MQDRIIRDKECEETTGLSRTTRWRQEREGKFPKRLQIGKQAIGWRESEIQEWIDGHSDVSESADE